ncbi:MAG: class I SAM-dependent methyltransferase [Alphaproteobacteria bacterium]|nr:class I SAM-dependent methyltransferase [Alphaproteobacteria bacterium]MBF0249721.1 class I SAM-dependent methyltransferase [Alphaproteobacteria bacterium]
MPLPAQCPICSAEHHVQSVVSRHVYGGKKGQAIFHCEQCDIRYLHPGLSHEEEAKLYAEEFEKFMEKRSSHDAGWETPEAHIEANAREAARRSAFLLSRLPARGKVLEIGCSSGFMLHELKAKGYDCVGVEPSGVFSDYVKHRGIACFNSLDDLLFDPAHADGFDVVLHYYVMEHISEVTEFLDRQIHMLKPSGIIVFEVPNATDALSSLYDIAAYEKFIWVVSHRWYFSTRSMEHLLRGFGMEFEIHMDQRYDLSNHLTWAIDGRPGGHGRFTNELGQDLEDHYKRALVAAGKGDTLTVVVRNAPCP